MCFIRFRGKKNQRLHLLYRNNRPVKFYIFTLFKNAKLLEKGRPNHFVLFQTTGQIGKVNINKQGSSFPQLLYCAE